MDEVVSTGSNTVQSCTFLHVWVSLLVYFSVLPLSLTPPPTPSLTRSPSLLWTVLFTGTSTLHQTRLLSVCSEPGPRASTGPWGRREQRSRTRRYKTVSCFTESWDGKCMVVSVLPSWHQDHFYGKKHITFDLPSSSSLITVQCVKYIHILCNRSLKLATLQYYTD